MVVIGPGLSLQEETVRLVKELAEAIKVPLLIDGDGLTAMRKSGNITNPEGGNNPDARTWAKMARLTENKRLKLTVIKL